MVEPGNAAVPRRQRRRWRNWLVLAVAAMVLVGWLARSGYLRVTLRPTPRPEYWLEQLRELDPPGPGSITWAEAKALLGACASLVDSHQPPGRQRFVGGTGMRQPVWLHSVLIRAWDESRSDIQNAGALFSSTAFRDAQNATRKAVEAGWWDSSIDLSPSGTFDPPVLYRDWAESLLAHSRWAREQAQDAGAMEDDWLIVLGLARQLRRSHLHEYEYEATRVDNLVANEIALTSREGLLHVDTLGLARRVAAVRGNDNWATKMMLAERIRERCQLEYYFVREGGGWADLTAMSPAYRTARTGGFAAAGLPPSRLWNLASPLFHGHETAGRHADEFWTPMASFPDMRAGWRAQGKRGGRMIRAISVLDGKFSTEADHIALTTQVRSYASMSKMDASVTTLALAEYFRKQQQFPDTLGELVPDYLPRLPMDYADRQTLRYRRTGNGYVLYSIGPDGVDNGGRFEQSRIPDDPYGNSDLVFSGVTRATE